jgi:CRP/FNR family cyclic AMP-dependent transcriptional regulator
MFKSSFLKTLQGEGRIVFKSRFLKNLSHTESYEFIQLCHRRSFKIGEYIYHQGDPGNGMYFIESGQVELIVENQLKTNEAENGESAFILDPPECFGNLSLAYDMRRMSSARAVSDVKVLGFFAADLDTLQKRHPKIALKFMNEVNRTLARQLEATIKTLVSNSDIADAYRLQFETYYASEENTEY